MADHVSVLTASGQVHTGAGQVMGISITASAGAPHVTFYDNVGAGGTIIYDAFVSYLSGVHLFLPERFGLFFIIGLYVSVAAGASVNIWWRDL
jgi:hypothetical protein